VTRLLVVRLGSLGDLVHTLPAVSALRGRFPAAEIDWLVDAVHEPFLKLVPVLSSIVVLRDRRIGAWLAARRDMRARRYDVALDFQGLIKSAALARFSGAARVIGFDRRDLREPAAATFYTERVAVGEGQHVIRKNLRLAAAVGATSDRLDFPLVDVDSAAVDAIAGSGIDRFALVNPGAAWPNKRWPPSRFADVTRWLLDRHGLRSVVLWGPGESGLADDIAAHSNGAAVKAPPTAIPDLVALARRASLVISGDTGPLHIAAAVGVPAVALFGPTNPHRNGPWAASDVSISLYDRCDCHYERRCRRPADSWCLGTIAIVEVETAVERVLSQASPGLKTGRSNHRH
jgi:lipopolysaccharide heptosyltransferase I